MAPKIRNACIGEFIIDTSDVNQIVYNPKAEIIITFAFSPYCGPCLAKINRLLSFMDKYEIGLRFIFCMKSLEMQNERSLVEYFITEYYNSPDSLVKLLKGYSENYHVMRQQCKTFKTQSQSISKTISIHDQWFKHNKFIGTPIILFNNLLIPPNYLADDLELMIVEEQSAPHNKTNVSHPE